MPGQLTTAVPTLGNDELPNIYPELVTYTRQALQKVLISSPAADILMPYFRRGKMLRARLVYAASAAVGAEPEDVHEGAQAIELLHGASLLHDDIIDQAAERRGLVSVHEMLGVEQALVLGDDLLLLAFSALGEARKRHPADRVLEAMDELTRLARECCRGQYEELRATRWISEAKYLEIACDKTAAQFVAACTIGAVLGGASEQELAPIRTCAKQMGIAFQIGDDLLDLMGDSHDMGKPVGNSLALGRPLLPLIYLWEADPAFAKDEVRHMAERDWSLDELLRQLEKHQILQRVREVQQRHAAAAVEALREFDDVAGVEALRLLALRAAKAIVPRQATAQATTSSSDLDVDDRSQRDS